jgi:hypothetical protein
MMPFIPPRLRKPAGIALAGAVFAAAWLIRGGSLWWVAILAVIAAAARAALPAAGIPAGTRPAHNDSRRICGEPGTDPRLLKQSR